MAKTVTLEEKIKLIERMVEVRKGLWLNFNDEDAKDAFNEWVVLSTVLNILKDDAEYEVIKNIYF